MRRKKIKFKPVKHIAFIMDGNGRWAKKHLLTRSMGHKAGVAKIKEIVASCFDDYGIYAVSLFTFSTENWNRPKKEIEILFELLEEFFRKEIDYFMKRGTKIQVLGNLEDERIPSSVKKVILNSIEKTKNNDKNIFNVLFNYGARFEILNATKNIAEQYKENKINLNDINYEYFEKNLYTGELSDVDLLIRTSGEQRLSNCLLYQVAYAEFVFTSCYWPDFDKKGLRKCLIKFSKRERRFGEIKDDE